MKKRTYRRIIKRLEATLDAEAMWVEDLLAQNRALEEQVSRLETLRKDLLDENRRVWNERAKLAEEMDELYVHLNELKGIPEELPE